MGQLQVVLAAPVGAGSTSMSPPGSGWVRKDVQRVVQHNVVRGVVVEDERCSRPDPVVWLDEPALRRHRWPPLQRGLPRWWDPSNNASRQRRQMAPCDPRRVRDTANRIRRRRKIVQRRWNRRRHVIPVHERIHRHRLYRLLARSEQHVDAVHRIHRRSRRVQHGVHRRQVAAQDNPAPATGIVTPAYDYRGNMTALNGDTYTYDAAGRHTSTIHGATTVTYTRDATNDIVARVDSAGTTTRYSGDAVLDTSNAVTERTLTLPGGVLVTKRAAGDVWSYPNIHGDVVATWVPLREFPPSRPSALCLA